VSVSAALGQILLNSSPNSVWEAHWCEPALLRDGRVAPHSKPIFYRGQIGILLKRFNSDYDDQSPTSSFTPITMRVRSSTMKS
jgi:hypothetical protein